MSTPLNSLPVDISAPQWWNINVGSLSTFISLDLSIYTIPVAGS